LNSLIKVGHVLEVLTVSIITLIMEAVSISGMLVYLYNMVQHPRRLSSSQSPMYSSTKIEDILKPPSSLSSIHYLLCSNAMSASIHDRQISHLEYIVNPTRRFLWASETNSKDIHYIIKPTEADKRQQFFSTKTFFLQIHFKTL
jgi:hypothetical protein